MLNMHINHIRRELIPKRQNIQIDPSSEFAKLDALLADLLSEVEQPILLNQDGTTNINNKNIIKNKSKCEILKNLDEIERSVDYLNEQKEKYKLNNDLYYNNNKNIIVEEEDSLNNSNLFRKIKSKHDYFISNSNNQVIENFLNRNAINSSSASINRLRYPTNHSASSYKSDILFANNEQKPPISPNNKLCNNIETKIGSQIDKQNIQQLNSISNLNDADDDLECSSMKSAFSISSTIQRSKYHTISNNYVESTGPKLFSKNLQTKRAFSAPPEDMGKIFLQRIELKSPLTIKNDSLLCSQGSKENNSFCATNQDIFVPNQNNNRKNIKLKTLQPQPQRIRALSERPYHNFSGYDTDSGVLNRNVISKNPYGSRNYDIDSDIEGHCSLNRYSNNKRLVNINGYDTDSELINARKSLNQRLIYPKNDSSSFKPNMNLDYNPMNKIRNPVNLTMIDLERNSNFKHKSQNSPSSYFDENHNILNFPNQISDKKKDVDENFDSNKSAFHSIVSKKSLNNNDYLKNENKNLIRSKNKTEYESDRLLLAVNESVIEGEKNDHFNKNSEIRILNSSNELKPWKIVHDIQNYWYKPKISREDAISLLKNKPPGTFLIRDSNNFPGAYGLAMKVEKLPSNIPIKLNVDQSSELVRHFLIEPTSGGVRIKGCCNEPVFVNLSSLVYQHLINPLALPCKLVLPSNDLQNEIIVTNVSNKLNKSNERPSNDLLEKGAACYVFYIDAVNVNHLDGYYAIDKAIETLHGFNVKDNKQPQMVQFKVNSNGIFFTDTSRKKLMKYHLPTESINCSAVDENRTWHNKIGKIEKPQYFGVVCSSQINSKQNQCYVFVEIDPEQPAIAIVDFINRYLIPTKKNV